MTISGKKAQGAAGAPGDVASRMDDVHDVLTRCYTSVSFEMHRAAADLCNITTSGPLVDAVSAMARSSHPMLNEMAVARRLCQAFARERFSLAAETGLAVRSIVSRHCPSMPPPFPDYALSVEGSTSVRHRLDAIRVTLVRRRAPMGCRTELTFGVMADSAVRFIRKGRNFADFSDVVMKRQEGRIETVSANQFVYYPGEADRCIDGSRMDHVPAIVLSNIIYAAIGNSDANVLRDTIWTFPYYTDPRFEFTIEIGATAQEVRVEQDGRVTVAVTALRPEMDA